MQGTSISPTRSSYSSACRNAYHVIISNGAYADCCTKTLPINYRTIPIYRAALARRGRLFQARAGGLVGESGQHPATGRALCPATPPSVIPGSCILPSCLSTCAKSRSHPSAHSQRVGFSLPYRLLALPQRQLLLLLRALVTPATLPPRPAARPRTCWRSTTRTYFRAKYEGAFGLISGRASGQARPFPVCTYTQCTSHK